MTEKESCYGGVDDQELGRGLGDGGLESDHSFVWCEGFAQPARNGVLHEIAAHAVVEM